MKYTTLLHSFIKLKPEMESGKVSTNESAGMAATDQSEAAKLTPIPTLQTLMQSWDQGQFQPMRALESRKLHIGMKAR